MTIILKCTFHTLKYFFLPGIVIVRATLPIVDDSTYWANEGTATQSLEFDFKLIPSSLATYSVGGSGTSDLWSIGVFFSPNPDGIPALVEEQTLTTLTPGQKTALFDPPSTTTIYAVEAPAVNVPSNVICSDVQYFCARLGQGANPSPDFELIGDPDDRSLLGCTNVTCRGRLENIKKQTNKQTNQQKAKTKAPSESRTINFE